MNKSIDVDACVVLAGNMLHDARNGVHAEIGSGIFTPEELRNAATALRLVPDLLEALEFCAGTSYITDAHEVAEAALAKAKEQA